MKTHKKWIVVLGLLASSIFACNGDTNNSGLGTGPSGVISSNREAVQEKWKQKQDALKAAQKNYQELLKAYPWVKQLENSAKKAEIAFLKVSAQETGAIKEERSRLRDEIIKLKDRHLEEHRKKSFEMTMALGHCSLEIYNLKQQIANLAAATNNTAVANRDRMFLEAELATARQKFKSLKKTQADLVPKTVTPSDEEVAKQRELQQEFARLSRQLSDATSTNIIIREAQAELVRWKQQLALAISTNAPLQEAKNKLESAYKD